MPCWDSQHHPGPGPFPRMKETLPRSKPWSPHQRPLLGVAQQCSKTGPAGGGCYLVAKLCPTLSQPQGPQSMGFSRQEYWSGLPHPPRGIFPTQESNLSLLHQQVDSLPLSHLGSPRFVSFAGGSSSCSRVSAPGGHLCALWSPTSGHFLGWGTLYLSISPNSAS